MTSIIAYHGTANPVKITEFKAGASSYIYFSNLQRVAYDYADSDADIRADAEQPYQEHIITASIIINNPFEFDAELGEIDFLHYADILEDAFADGHDGAIIHNPLVFGCRVEGIFIIPSQPQQIKIIAYEDL